MTRERVGRIIAGAGGACAAVLWSLVLFGSVLLLMEPPNLGRFALVFLIPMSPLVMMLVVASILDVVVLWRRADRRMPWRIGWVHLVLAVGCAVMGRHAWPAAMIFAAIGASQLLALRLFQITPSHA